MGKQICDTSLLVRISTIRHKVTNFSPETQTVPEKPDLATLMGGFEECSSWLLSYVASTNQYCRNENDLYNKIKREFSVFTEKEEVIRELRAIADKVSFSVVKV